MSKLFNFFKKCLVFWRSILVLIIPLFLLPLPIVSNTTEARCAYVGIIMAIFWMLELLPLYVTSLLPVALFPLLGIMSTEEVTKCYMEDTCMLYLGGLTVALAIEETNLHRRVALHVLKFVGTSPRMLLIGFMFPTGILSMWISNTAASAMMIPILDAVLTEVISGQEEDEEKGQIDKYEEKEKSVKQDLNAKKMRAMLAMSVCMSANVGGTGTTIGTGPNLVLLGFIEDEKFTGQPLSFGTWLAFAVPQMLLCLFIIWIYLQVVYLPLPFTSKESEEKTEERNRKHEKVQNILAQQLTDLGPMSFQEYCVSFLFLVLVLLWFFRSPGFFTGWADALGSPVSTDATPAVLIAMLLFIIPSQPNFLALFDSSETRAFSSPAILSWKTFEKKMSWGLIILFGGGFALAAGTEASGLSSWIGDQLEQLESLSPRIIVIVLSLLACGLTQVTSNVTTATIIIPIVLELSQRLQLNPLYLVLPPTFMCSFAFMLPISTPPNAIAYEPSGLSTLQMAALGTPITFLCFAVSILSIETYGYSMFDLGTYPDWMPNKTTQNFFS